MKHKSTASVLTSAMLRMGRHTPREGRRRRLVLHTREREAHSLSQSMMVLSVSWPRFSFFWYCCTDT